MTYLVTRQWTIPDVTQPCQMTGAVTEADHQPGLMAVVCRDCSHHNAPRTVRCRRCKSPRVRLVNIDRPEACSHKAAPRRWPADKPN